MSVRSCLLQGATLTSEMELVVWKVEAVACPGIRPHRTAALACSPAETAGARREAKSLVDFAETAGARCEAKSLAAARRMA